MELDSAQPSLRLTLVSSAPYQAFSQHWLVSNATRFTHCTQHSHLLSELGYPWGATLRISTGKPFDPELPRRICGLQPTFATCRRIKSGAPAFETDRTSETVTVFMLGITQFGVDHFLVRAGLMPTKSVVKGQLACSLGT